MSRRRQVRPVGPLTMRRLASLVGLASTQHGTQLEAGVGGAERGHVIERTTLPLREANRYCCP